MDHSDKLKILSELIRIQSVNGHEGQVADYLLHLFARHGVPAHLEEQLPGRANLVAELGDGQGPVLALAGHEDTVHQGDEQAWLTDPFAATEKGSRIFGRGTSDMKAGLAQFAIAMIDLHEAGVPLHGKVRLLASISEELTEEGARYLADKGLVDDVEAMLIAEPTGVALTEIPTYFATEAAVIEPAALAALTAAIPGSSAPEQHFIVTAHKGWMAYTVTASGKAAHSSMPKMGINAIDSLVAYYLKEKAFYASLTQVNPILGPTVYSPDIIRGGEQVNSVPSQAYEQVKVRTIPELPNAQLIAQLQALIDDLNRQGHQLKITVDAGEIPVERNDRDRLVRTLQRQAPVLHEPANLPTIGVSLGTDASEYRQANPQMEVAILGPGNTSAHQANEYVEKTSYFDMIDVFEATIRDYLAPKA